MSLSLAGVIVCTGLLLLGIYLRGPLIIALFASFAFGSTAIATLGFLGNSSPLIYAFIAGLLFLSVLLRRHFLHELNIVFSRSWVPWLIVALPVYAVAGAIILPRVFAGQTSVFVPARDSDGVFELPLAPVSGNVTQAAYFTIGALTFLAISVLLVKRENLLLIRRGFFTFSTLLTILGLIDVTAKGMGYGDVFWLIRSAGYTMHTDTAAIGFSRITGAYTEASVFGSATLASLVFTFTYWRRTASTFALSLSIVLAGLLLLSTSTTAYMGAAIMATPIVASIFRSMLAGRLSWSDLSLFGLVIVCIAVVLSMYAYSTEILAPFVSLFETAILNKPLSASAHERAYWNQRSLQSFFDTFGLGIGLGSSRSSSWVISVLSQLGLTGALMLSLLVIELMRGIPQSRSGSIDLEVIAIHDSVRSFAIAGLVASTLAGSGADPGPPFFIALATVLACRERGSRLVGSATAEQRT